MKNIAITAIILLASFLAKSQIKKPKFEPCDTCKIRISYDYYTPRSYVSVYSSSIDTTKEISVIDITGKVVLIGTKDSIIVIDSAQSNNTMVNVLFWNAKFQEEEAKIRYAAEAILSCLTIDGRVSNRKEFDKAVKNYNILFLSGK